MEIKTSIAGYGDMRLCLSCGEAFRPKMVNRKTHRTKTGWTKQKHCSYKCYQKWYKTTAKERAKAEMRFPSWRCEFCKTVSSLEFDPKSGTYNKVRWLNFKCPVCGTENRLPNLR